MVRPKREKVHFDDEIFLVGDTYVYRGTPPGARKQREISTGLKKGAPQKDILRAKRAILEGAEKLGARLGKNTFLHISEIYFEGRELEAKDPEILSQSTLRETRIILRKHLQPAARSKRIDELDQPWFNQYCIEKRAQGLNLANHRKVINHFLGWCVSDGYLRVRPELKIPKAAIKPRRARVVLTDDEIKRLLEACMRAEGGRILLYVKMYLLMGMRNMEICRLRWDEIDLDRAALKINRLSNRRRKERVIPINDFVLSSLKEAKEGATSEWVFPAIEGAQRFPHISPDGGFRSAWLTALKRANLTGKITPHDLRATFETFMHTNTDFTDTQREKMAGAKIDVQKNTYVKMDVRHLRGLEGSVNVKGISEILLRGNSRGMGKKKKSKGKVSPRQKGTISK